MRSKRTIIPELVTKWGAGDALHSIYYMGESSISTLPRKFAKKIEVLNLGRDSLSPIKGLNAKFLYQKLRLERT